MGSHTFEIEALLLVLPTTEYQKMVPVVISTTVTDMAVDYISQNHPKNLSQSWKAVHCATQSRQLVLAQPIHKYFVKTTKPVTLLPFSTTTIKGSTKLRSHGMRLNLIAEPSESMQLPPNVQCASTYCILEPGSNRIAIGLRNVSAKFIIIPSRTVVGNCNRPGWYLMIRLPNYRINRVPLGGGGILGFGPTTFRGIR